MALHVLRDPRDYLLTVMAVALIVLVPVMFVFINMTETLFSTGFNLGETLLWALFGLIGAGLLGGVMVILSRATRQYEAEHPQPRDDK